MKKMFILSILLLSGCDRIEKVEKPKTDALAFVKGQIFVIRADRENVKLGGVVVHYVSYQDFKERAEWIALNSDRMRYLRKYRHELSNAQSWIREESKERVFQPEFRTFIRQSEDLISIANRRFVDNPLLEELTRIETIREENTDLFESTDFRADPESQWTIGSLYFDWLKNNSAYFTETDADGLFRLKIPSGSKGFILARASRALSSSHEEHYYWIKEVRGSGEEELMLTSTATITRQTLKEILDLSEKAQGSSSSLIQKEFSLIPMDWTEQCERVLVQIKKNEVKSGAIDEKIKTLEDRIESVKIESTP